MTGSLFRAYSLSVIFFAIISFPFINDRLQLVADTQNFENRRLSQKPPFDIQNLDPYPAAFEAYYNDTFALRSRIINYFNIYNCVFLSKSTFPAKIIIGKNRWLYIVGPDIETYLGQNRLTEKELLTYKHEFEFRKKQLESQNCKFYILIAPGKANVHPENLPFTYIRENTQCWGQQLIDYMNKNSDVNMIDIFGPFQQLKSQEAPLYFSDDNHWNKLGGFYAANIATAAMSKDFPVLKPQPIGGMNVKKEPASPGNLKSLLGNLDIFESVQYNVIPKKGFFAVDISLPYLPQGYCPYPESYALGKEIKNSGQPRLLIFSDSFGGNFFPFISENFSRTVKVFAGWDYTLINEIIEQEKPDAVLIVVHEPLIRNILKHLSYPGHPE